MREGRSPGDSAPGTPPEGGEGVGTPAGRDGFPPLRGW
ncbi:hypothetical protein SLNWT_3344 [Streptomyces albus]|uniref:Uncharacterized protein n=1 Tax=Streptomyces albus (strain ATCC 21838 / DSM 41398 / FERM P-419 / JCM 4703 / NBRC 107858) TaxID=1081613 RepID=A0A0B5EWY7_STRA4|nr:hypothetical protein SLNWT_3344 [Streptomyces albus]